MEDYSVLEAADAAQCRYMLSNNDVDLVILDIMPPTATEYRFAVR